MLTRILPVILSNILQTTRDKACSCWEQVAEAAMWEWWSQWGDVEWLGQTN